MPSHIARAPFDTDDDSALLERARSEPAAFGEFYARHHGDVVAYFYKRVMCPHTAADLASETFAEALLHIKRYKDDRGTARGWVFGIAANQFRTWCRKGRVADRARKRLGVEPVALPDDALERIETLADMEPFREAVSDALHHLSPALRDAVLLRIGRDMTYDEVAAQLGVSVGTARVRVSRALAQLGEELDQLERVVML